MRTLHVFWQQSGVGALEEAPEGLRFAYSDAWLKREGAFPISVSLPLRDEAFTTEAQTFFGNLLPEGDLRRLLCRRLGISDANDFELLKAIGGECAGALSLLPEGEMPKKQAEYRPLDLRKLKAFTSGGGVLPTLDGQRGLRLSLAGVQDKLPVFVQDEEYFLPLGSSPSSHILKFENPHFKHLPANEVLATLIAERVGLHACKVELKRVGRRSFCLVQRYDRVKGPDGTLERLHQEDMCQALAVSPSRKYEKEGGPTFAQVYASVMQASVRPGPDGRKLLSWLAFNVLLLNADAHGKNLSFLYDRDGEAQLAPFYDLLCTRAYEGVDRHLAMTVGGESDPTHIRAAHWEKLAEDLGVGKTFVKETVAEMADGFLTQATARAAERFRELYGESPILQMVLPKVRRQAKRVLQHLK